MKGKGVSLRDVARLAGVSPGTASRVLSGSTYPVSDDARGRVQEAARSLNYVANSVARALVTGRTAVLGAIVHDVTDPFFSGVVRSLQDVAVANGLVVLVGNDDRDATKLEACLTMLFSQKPAGVVLIGGQLRDSTAVLPVAQAVQRLRDQGVPVVGVGRYELDIPHVAVDEQAAATCAVQHLLDLGHRHIAFVGGVVNSTTVEDRYAGYVTALARAGIRLDDDLVVRTPLTLEGGSAAVAKLMERATRFTAVYCTTDDVAFGVISGLRSHALEVPSAVSVIGTNDVPMAAHVEPPLTTIRVCGRGLGSAAWELLVAEWDRGEGDRRPRLPFELVVRASTMPPATAPSSTPGRRE